MLEQLIEETRDLYDGSAFLVGAFGETPAKELVANVHYRRAFLLSTPKSTLFWTRVIVHQVLDSYGLRLGDFSCPNPGADWEQFNLGPTQK